MNFIAIEGLDGAGKSTQIQMMHEHLGARGIRACCLHFPRTDTGIFGDMAARFLRGEFGKIDGVHPYLVALLYAEDRRSAAPEIRDLLNDGGFFIADRYVYSNIAYQCAKVADEEEQERLREWILNLEYTEFGIPKPQMCLFLDAPIAFTRDVIEQGRTGRERQYLQGRQDIHEADSDFQRRVREVYLRQASRDSNFRIVPCTDGDTGKMLPPHRVFENIMRHITI